MLVKNQRTSKGFLFPLSVVVTDQTIELGDLTECDMHESEVPDRFSQ